ncbi:MAG TPA: hypothetical protein VE338_11885 [Ktedonobacterales bacterium]|nr:hypothetical protein [Ktedonobacterales bacterium]
MRLSAYISGPPISLRYVAVALSAALLAIEGVSSLGLALPTTGSGALRMALDVALALALAVVAAARIPAPPAIARLYARMRPLAVVGALLLLFVTGLALINTARLILFTAPPHYFVTDVVGFTDECARLTLAGRNCYTSPTGFVEALRRFPYVTPSPLRGHVFGVGADYPSHSDVSAVERRYLADPSATPGAFDPRTLTSYPALSFLLYVPLVWLGLPDILLLNLLVFVALAVWLVARAPRHERVWTTVAFSAALPLLLYSLIADTEVVALAFLLLAWRFRERRWVSAIALGLGCAFRQYCWFFAPFLLLDALLHHGWREAVRRAFITLGAFLVPNLPYLIASPGAWWASLWLPISEPLFPLGVGLVALSKGHLLPYAPTALYTTLEVIALLLCLWAQWRWRARLREAVPLLALIPLYFAWRSLPNYFAIAPLLALFAIGALLHARAEGTPAGVAATRADTSPQAR